MADCGVYESTHPRPGSIPNSSDYTAIESDLQRHPYCICILSWKVESLEHFYTNREINVKGKEEN
jgi:hypothetical protein